MVQDLSIVPPPFVPPPSHTDTPGHWHTHTPATVTNGRERNAAVKSAKLLNIYTAIMWWNNMAALFIEMAMVMFVIRSYTRARQHTHTHARALIHRCKFNLIVIVRWVAIRISPHFKSGAKIGYGHTRQHTLGHTLHWNTGQLHCLFFFL